MRNEKWGRLKKYLPIAIIYARWWYSSPTVSDCDTGESCGSAVSRHGDLRGLTVDCAVGSARARYADVTALAVTFASVSNCLPPAPVSSCPPPTFASLC